MQCFGWDIAELPPQEYERRSRRALVGISYDAYGNRIYDSYNEEDVNEDEDEDETMRLLRRRRRRILRTAILVSLGIVDVHRRDLRCRAQSVSSSRLLNINPLVTPL